MKITTFVTSGIAALIVFWTVLAFVRFEMIMTIASGFAGAGPGDRLIQDARMSFLLGCVGTSMLLGGLLAALIQRMRMTRKGRAPHAYHPAACAELSST